MDTIFVGNDNIVKVNSLTDEADNTYINNATGTGTLKDEDDATLATYSFSYVTSSDGNYQTTIPDTALITAGKCYTLLVDLDGGVGKKYYKEISLKAVTRT